MAHHHHHEGETYFLDQICMVALSGAFGVICLCLFFVQKGMLYLLLGEQFHPFVLASGITLVVLALIRAGMLWSLAGPKRSVPIHEHDDPHAALDHAMAHDHGHAHSHSHAHGHGECEHEGAPSHSHGADECGHDHGHSHSHSHGDCGHDHAHSHAAIAESRAFGHMPSSAPAAGHSHAHGHSHSHGDGPGDHDHGWAPWRYVVLLVPIILFMLGLPNKPPTINAGGSQVDTTRDTIEEAQFYFTLAGLSADRSAPIGLLLARAATDADAGELVNLNFKLLAETADSSADREYYKGKSVRAKGQILPRSDRYFELVRFKINCCAGDAIQLSVPVLAKDSIVMRKAEIWVEVVGKIDFRRDSTGKYKTILHVSSRNQVKETNPDLNPYVQ